MRKVFLVIGNLTILSLALLQAEVVSYRCFLINCNVILPETTLVSIVLSHLVHKTLPVMAATITELLSIREANPSQFETVLNPEKIGNAVNHVYGGNTLGVAIIAAQKTVPFNFFLYSALGNFLGPASKDRKLQCSVRSLRTTKAFATRHVEVHQTQPNGGNRPCLFLTADFQTAEAGSLLTYSRPPRLSYSSVNDCPTVSENRQNLLARNFATEETVSAQKEIYGLIERFFDCRACPEGVLSQNLPSLSKTSSPTTQDHLPLPAKTSADYFRSKRPLQTPAENVSALAFMLDMSLTFLPLVHSGQSLVDDVSALLSLDFAFRVFTNDVDLNAWHLRELSTVAGGEGRTYTEAQVWDGSGRMVCNMTQQSILRPKSKETAKI